MGNSGSGAFFVLRNLKKGLAAGVFLGVTLGLCWDDWSIELASDRDDSDWRFPRGWSTVEFRGPADDEVSSKEFKDGGPLSLLNDFLNVLRTGGRRAASSSRGISLERRSFAARPTREGFFAGPTKSLVGAVVMISGADVERQYFGPDARLPLQARPNERIRGTYDEAREAASRRAAWP